MMSPLAILFVVTILFGFSHSTDDACNNITEPISYSHHHSWKSTNIASPNIDEIETLIDTLLQLQQEHESDTESDRLVPIYNVSDPTFNPNNPDTQSEIYDSFYNKYGALIVTGAYENETMTAYNEWCEYFLEIAKKTDKNCRHPKQSGKYLINDIIHRLGRNNSDLLLRLINNKHLTLFSDILLGFMKYGSVTTHWIESAGDKQLSHVDYPIHVGSGPFWQNSVHKLLTLTTANQLNHILPYFSVQILVASDAMDHFNGATQLVPYSHLLPNIDALILDERVYKAVEPFFKSVTLQKGDFLIFNRRLLHRGGHNQSRKRRNSLILQCVWLWGVGQEIIDYKHELSECLRDSNEFNRLSVEEKEIFLTRVNPPYPADIKKQT